VGDETRTEYRTERRQLFGLDKPPFDFDGATYQPIFDRHRLTGQLLRVAKLMSDARWRTLGEIKLAVFAGSESAISARLRDLRKEKFGSHLVERRHRGEAERGLYEYRLLVNRQ
jgi:hypothetical protein